MSLRHEPAGTRSIETEDGTDMRIAELLDILRDYPQDWEVELAVIAPVDDEDADITVDRYSIEGVLPWEEDEDDQKLLWLVGGEDDNVDAFLDALDGEG